MQRIAIASEDDGGLDATVAQHFGRCPYYTIADVEGADAKEVRAIDNPFFNHHEPGTVPPFINSQGVNVMIAGGMGRRAISLFDGFGIRVVTGVSGRVGDVLTKYLSGQLSGSEECRGPTGLGHEGPGHGCP